MKATLATLFALSLPIGLLAQTPVNSSVPDSFQINYGANLDRGDSALNFTNSGANGGANICLNLYVFSPDEQEETCCSCSISPNSLYSAALLQGLLTNPLTGGQGNYLRRFNSAVVKVIATNGSGGCNASNVTAANLAPGLVAWGTHSHRTNTDTVAITETLFAQAALSAQELARATTFCGFAQQNGSGAGVCPGCLFGGLSQTAYLTPKLKSSKQ